MKTKFIFAFVVLLTLGFIGLRFYVKSFHEEHDDTSEVSIPSKAPHVAKPDGKVQGPTKGEPAPTKDDAWKKQVSPEILQRIADEEKARNTPEAKAQERAFEAVKAWETTVDKVLSPGNKTPLNDRGRQLKKSLDAITDESDRLVAVQTLLNQLSDEQFSMVDEMLFFPQTEADRDVADALFSDLLNRPESLKEGYIKKISEMREHPNHVDALHIRTVTSLGDK